MRLHALLLATTMTAYAAVGQAQVVKAGALTLNRLVVRASLGNVPTTAAYLTITNGGMTADRLLAVECVCAATAMMHRSETVNGVASMSMLGSVDIPPGRTVTFSPTGLHIMLTGMKGRLTAGDSQEMTLRFEKAGPVKVRFQVRDAVAPALAGRDKAAMPGMKH